jgi:hypothetical protein
MNVQNGSSKLACADFVKIMNTLAPPTSSEKSKDSFFSVRRVETVKNEAPTLLAKRIKQASVMVIQPLMSAGMDKAKAKRRKRIQPDTGEAVTWLHAPVQTTVLSSTAACPTESKASDSDDWAHYDRGRLDATDVQVLARKGKHPFQARRFRSSRGEPKNKLSNNIKKH